MIMEKVAASTGNATVTDYRRDVDGKTNPQYGKEIEVKYDIEEHEVVSTIEEVNKKFSEEQIISMCQSRQNATANSAARQKAVSAYAASGDDLAKENMIKAIMALKKGIKREEAEKLAEAALV
jgi:hypothetical protein